MEHAKGVEMIPEDLKRMNDALLKRRAEQSSKRIDGEPLKPLANEILSKLRVKVVPDEVAKQLEIQSADEERKRKVVTLWNQAGIPDKFIKRKEFEQVPRWIETRKTICDKVGTGFLYALIGDRGVGKSQLSSCVIGAGCHKLRSGLYVVAQDMFSEFKASYGKSGEQAVLRKYNRIKTLVIDEIGRRTVKESGGHQLISPWEQNLIYQIIDYRYREELDTLLISNETIEEFSVNTGPSILSRLNETGSIIEATIKNGWKCFRE